MRAYERLLHYVTFDTASDPESPTCPAPTNRRCSAPIWSAR